MINIESNKYKLLDELKYKKVHLNFVNGNIYKKFNFWKNASEVFRVKPVDLFKLVRGTEPNKITSFKSSYNAPTINDFVKIATMFNYSLHIFEKNSSIAINDHVDKKNMLIFHIGTQYPTTSSIGMIYN